jgi:hypothetical protein
MVEALRNQDAAFPSLARAGQPIKLPRQHNVDKDEYREFLNLGHGDIFNLDLDRCGGVGSRYNHTHAYISGALQRRTALQRRGAARVRACAWRQCADP